jgi:hypothetical protein
VRQQADNVGPMIRPTWNPDDEQRKLLDAAIAAAVEADEREDAAWVAIRKAREAGVPDTILCERTKRSRATLNRKFGARQSRDQQDE